MLVNGLYIWQFLEKPARIISVICVIFISAVLVQYITMYKYFILFHVARPIIGRYVLYILRDQFVSNLEDQRRSKKITEDQKLFSD